MIVMVPPNLGAKADELLNNKSYVLQACRSMLRPIVRMLLKSGVVHRVFINLSREVYIDVARKEFGLRGRPTSISRTALLTGLARKEVRRIMNIIDSDDTMEYEPGNQDRLSRVLSGWHQDKDYLTREGQPLAIPANGPTPSFADLKSRYGGDVPSVAILRELVSCGNVEKTDNLYRPVKRNYAPNPADPKHLLRAGSVMEDVGTTVMRNLYRKDDSEKWLERRASNQNIPVSLVPAFRKMLDTEGQAFLENIDDWLSQHEDSSDDEETVRVGLGMYIIKGPDEE
ncbi:MAG: hypothetical protein KJO35_06700, partial [Gammaproteobacteria bacterium]|nr:hypothetical protein [Gammaproteobacteria bacterium]NNF66730.1 hypothetical protein [Gammaproteobacteria bacterium]